MVKTGINKGFFDLNFKGFKVLNLINLKPFKIPSKTYPCMNYGLPFIGVGRMLDSEGGENIKGNGNNDG